MAGTTLSPNVDNIQVGKGIVSFLKDGDVTYRDLGNVSAMTFTPEVTTLEHFSSRQGTKKKDLVITLEQKGAVKMTMEEITPENFALMVYGSVDEAAVGGPEVEIFGSPSTSGALRFTGTNDQGPKVTVDFYHVTFTPTGDVGFISDEFNAMEVTADVLAAPSGANVGKFGVAKWTDITVGS